MAGPEPSGKENADPLEWFRDNQAMFAALGSLATVAAVIVGGYALTQTNKQLEATRKQLEATTVYNMQKDGRELMAAVKSDPEVWDYFFKHNPACEPYPAELKARADRELAIIMQFYSSLSNQRREGIISGDLWADVERDFCNFLHSAPVTKFWDETVMRGAYDDYFKETGQRCLGRQQSAPERRYFPPSNQ